MLQNTSASRGPSKTSSGTSADLRERCPGLPPATLALVPEAGEKDRPKACHRQEGRPSGLATVLGLPAGYTPSQTRLVWAVDCAVQGSGGRSCPLGRWTQAQLPGGLLRYSPHLIHPASLVAVPIRKTQTGAREPCSLLTALYSQPSVPRS